MSFTMKSKISSSLSLSLSLFPHLSVRLLLTLSATRPAPPPHVLRPVLLLCCAPPPTPTVCPSRRVEIARQLGCPTRLDFYYCDLPLLQNTLELYYRAMDVGNLRWRWPHTLLPAGRYPSNWSSPPILYYSTIYHYSLKPLTLYSFFQYFGIFSDRKNIPAPARGLSSLPVLDSLPIQRMEPRRLAA